MRRVLRVVRSNRNSTVVIAATLLLTLVLVYVGSYALLSANGQWVRYPADGFEKLQIWHPYYIKDRSKFHRTVGDALWKIHTPLRRIDQQLLHRSHLLNWRSGRKRYLDELSP